MLGQLFQGHIGLKSIGIQLIIPGNKNGFGTFFFQQIQVSFQRPGVGRQVFPRCKLGGVDKNAHHQGVTMPQPFTHEGEMPFMQKTHRRHKNNFFTKTAQFITMCLHLSGSFYSFDGKNLLN